MRASRLLPPLCHFKTRSHNPVTSTVRNRPQLQPDYLPGSALPGRPFSSTRIWRKDDYAEKAKSLNQKSQDEHEDAYNKQIDESIGEAKELQARTPWHREGSDKPPVKRIRSASAMAKGYFPVSYHFLPFKTCERLGSRKLTLVLVRRKATHDAFEATETDSSTHDVRQE